MLFGLIQSQLHAEIISAVLQVNTPVKMELCHHSIIYCIY